MALVLLLLLVLVLLPLQLQAPAQQLQASTKGRQSTCCDAGTNAVYDQLYNAAELFVAHQRRQQQQEALSQHSPVNVTFG